MTSGIYEPHKTQRNIALFCAVVKLINYSLYTFRTLIKLPYCILYTYCIILFLDRAFSIMKKKNKPTKCTN